jgi:hypothetical protein
MRIVRAGSGAPSSAAAAHGTRRLRRALLAFATLAALAALPAQRAAYAQRYVPGEHPDFPKIKYTDSLVSVNDRCIVKQSKLNLKVRPVYVNWRPIGFC